MPFYLFFSPLFFFRFFVFSCPFVVLRVPLPCSSFVLFVLSSCRFPFASCIAFFASIFASLLSLVADSVTLLFRLDATPPYALCEPEVCVFPLRAVFFPALMLSYTEYFFLLFHPFFDLDLDIVCFSSCLFLVGTMCCLLGFGFGICCDSFGM